MAHPSISEACVVGLEDQQYGEVVGCFLRRTVGAGKLPDETVRQWVTDTLGRMRAPKYVFWIGDSNVGSSLPKTGSGKIQKYLVRELGNKLLKEMGIKSKL
jgi:acyl-coenzyme A synthetase/AMP-(fatty) acid ligase